MENTGRNTQAESAPGRPNDLLYALNGVATTLQQSIQSERNVYIVFQQQVVSLNMRGGISLLDESGQNLCFKTIAFTNPLRKILGRFEHRFHLQAEEYSVPVDEVEVYQRVIRKSEAVFVGDTSLVAVQVAPRGVRGAIGPLLAFLGRPPGIFTPLIFDGQVKGMLNMVGPNLTANDIPAMRAFANQIAVALENARLVNRLKSARDEIEVAYESTLEGWVQALDLRDNETEGHTVRTAELAVQLGKQMGVAAEEIPHLRRGALLHDIGKMAIPDHILKKPGPLTDSEWEIMKQHPVMAYQWLSRIKFLEQAMDIPYCHHEHWDGSGYPRGLRGEKIPLAARIFTVVDVWDAMTSDRPYRKALTEAVTIEFLETQAGKLFDRIVVNCFLEMKQDVSKLTLR